MRAPRQSVTRIGGVVLALLVGLCATVGHADELARGDAAWSRRAEGAEDGRPAPGPIRAALRAYESALSARPESLEARWKWLRAAHFAGDFAFTDEDESSRLFDRAREVSERGLDLLVERLGGAGRLDEVGADANAARLAAADVSASDVARLYFWSAIHWGAWSRNAGLLLAVREGVANRMHRYSQITIALEPEYEEGGALRLLGRLHAELPRVPFVSGWVDRDEAIPLMERAFAMAPEHPGNRLLWAFSLLELAPDRRLEALARLEEVAELTPRPSMRIEELAIRQEARKRLAGERAQAPDPDVS